MENSHEKRPPSNLPESNIAREFIIRTLETSRPDFESARIAKEKFFEPDGMATKIFERFKHNSQPYHHRPEYRLVRLKVFSEPRSEFDREALHYLEGNVLFNNELAGLNLEILQKTSVNTQNGELIHETTAFWLIDEGRAAFGIVSRDSEFKAIAKEVGGETFKFDPSFCSVSYLIEFAEILAQSRGSDEERN